ncbi:uncharacterized protein B0H64DRAFT_443860 [Chaetomium fimeti]|uniref:UBC core domain-containing protein n=1 Tax=Chaetomium fimeti TaxID=1854472 RepID=A0AAE0LR62_9PEZI|nr:hypothetical protein B0H64DRAFT_443860 [Chaetomium fimeti]
MGGLPAFKRQHLLAEFTGLKQACPQGIFVSLTPGDPTLWSGVLFVRKGPYAPAILRFQISFPDTYPSSPPLVTFATDIFHPLLTPPSTYNMYSTAAADVRDGSGGGGGGGGGGSASSSAAAADDDRLLPPGGFSLRHGFAGWFGRGGGRANAAVGAVGAGAPVVAVAVAVEGEGDGEGDGNGGESGDGNGGGDGDDGERGRPRGDGPATTDQGEMVGLMTPTRAVATATGTTPASAASVVSSSASVPGHARTGGVRGVSTYEVLRYIRSTFDDEDVLDSVPLEAAGNPGAWHAWRTHRRQAVGKPLPVPGGGEAPGAEGEAQAERAPAPAPAAVAVGAAATTRRPGEWNWEGVWEDRVKRGIAGSLSEGVLYGQAGTTDDVINFLSMDDAEVEGAKSNLLRTLGAAAYRPSCRYPSSNRPGLSLSGLGLARDGSTNIESAQGEAGPGLPIAPEDLEDHNSPRRNPRSGLRLPPSYESGDDASTLHMPVRADPGSSTGPPSPPHFQDTCVLAPNIVVTPEYGAVDEGTVTVWVAVQLSTRICRALALDQGHGRATDDQSSLDAVRYGFLYNVSTELLPAGKSTIVEVLDDKACATVLYPGSRLLFIAHIRLGPAARYRPRTHVRQKSDELIEDLEHELGGTVTEYLQVRVTYCHSGFPQRHKQITATVNTTASDGIASIQTTIQTTATATIKRHNSTSPWSPPPCTPRPNPLFEVIASHWGAENAHAVMQRVIRSRAAASSAPNRPLSIPPAPAPTVPPHGQITVNEHRQKPQPQRTKPRTGQQIPPPDLASPSSAAAAAPPVPRRHASLRRVASAYRDADPERERSHHQNQQQQQQRNAEAEMETEKEAVSPTATVRRRKVSLDRDRDRRGKAVRAASVFRRRPGSSISFVSSPSSSSSSGGPQPPADLFRPAGVVAAAAAGRGYGGESVGSASVSAGSRAGKETEREKRCRVGGEWAAGGDAAPVGDVRRGGEGNGKGKGSEVGMVGRGGGSVKTRKGKEKEKGWGWTSWW